MKTKLLATILAAVLMFTLGACQNRKTVKGSGISNGAAPGFRRLELEELPARPLSLRVRGITVRGKLSRLENHMSITIYDDIAYPDTVGGDLHYGKVSIYTDDNINELISVAFDEAAGEIVIEPVRPGVAFAPEAMSITVQMPIDNLVVEDGAWAVWYTGPARGIKRFNAKLNDITDGQFQFSGEQPDSVNITFSGAPGAKLECSVNDELITLNGTGSIALQRTE